MKNFNNFSEFLNHCNQKAKIVKIPSLVIMSRVIETPPSNIKLTHSKFPSQLSAYDNISGKCIMSSEKFKSY